MLNWRLQRFFLHFLLETLLFGHLHLTLLQFQINFCIWGKIRSLLACVPSYFLFVLFLHRISYGFLSIINFGKLFPIRSTNVPFPLCLPLGLQMHRCEIFQDCPMALGCSIPLLVCLMVVLLLLYFFLLVFQFGYLIIIFQA